MCRMADTPRTQGRLSCTSGSSHRAMRCECATRSSVIADGAGVLLRSVTEAAIAAFEAAAGELGHGVGSWCGEEERIWLTSCTRCQRLGWIIRPGLEPWRRGGPMSVESCEEAK